jgi:thiamine monophosphate synthase
LDLLALNPDYIFIGSIGKFTDTPPTAPSTLPSIWKNYSYLSDSPNKVFISELTKEKYENYLKNMIQNLI